MNRLAILLCFQIHTDILGWHSAHGHLGLDESFHFAVDFIN